MEFRSALKNTAGGPGDAATPTEGLSRPVTHDVKASRGNRVGQTGADFSIIRYSRKFADRYVDAATAVLAKNTAGNLDFLA